MKGKKKIRVSLLVSHLLLWLGLCCGGAIQPVLAADTSGIRFNLEGFNEVLDSWFCPEGQVAPVTPQAKTVAFRLQKVEPEKNQFHGACYFKTGDGPEQSISSVPYYRIVRAQIILEVTTRVGAARISDYSETAEQDAMQLMLSLQDSRSKLKIARELLISQQNIAAVRTPLARTEVAISLLKTASYALSSVKSLFTGWYNPKAWLADLLANHGEKILVNLLKDRLYVSAYEETFANVISRLENQSDPNDLTLKNNLWTQTDGEILKQCLRLAQIANVSSDNFCAQ